MDDQPNTPHTSPFDAIRCEDDQFGEYWSARELYKILGYTQWRNFNNIVIKRAMKACEENGRAVSDHFVQSYKMVQLGSGSQRKTEDVLLSRYAAYLVVMNGDPKMPIVAMGQEYFAEQTRRQELADELAALPEDQKRLIRRAQMNIYNTQLAEAANQAGVIESRDFAIFQDHGYRGLYGGLGAKAIHERKGLKKSQHILDHMGSEELADNIFRAAQTEAKLRREDIQGKDAANRTHHEVGRKVREFIKELGGTMPEDLPTPDKSIQQLQRDEQKRIEQQRQPSLFETTEDEQ
jgi:DNA-damage-inducible protein D